MEGPNKDRPTVGRGKGATGDKRIAQKKGTTKAQQASNKVTMEGPNKGPTGGPTEGPMGGPNMVD